MESTGAGLMAGINAARLLRGEKLLVLPRETVLGALAHHITTADPEHFQPMNANFGILPPSKTEGKKMSKLQKKEARAEECLGALAQFLAQTGIGRKGDE